MPKMVRAKSWVEVEIDVPSSWVEGVSNFLIELGSPGVIQKDGSGGAKRKRETVLAYFPDPSSFPKRRKKIRRYLSDLSVLRGFGMLGVVIDSLRYAHMIAFCRVKV